jgi:hypothetical protein
LANWPFAQVGVRSSHKRGARGSVCGDDALADDPLIAVHGKHPQAHIFKRQNRDDPLSTVTDIANVWAIASGCYRASHDAASGSQ